MKLHLILFCLLLCVVSAGAQTRKPNIVLVLIDDFGEKYDLVRARPQQVEPLRKRLAAWRQAVGAQMMTPNPGNKPSEK
jgi:hypothetical protein